MRVTGWLLMTLIFLTLGCDSDPVSPRFTAEDPIDLQAEVTTQTSFRIEGINGEISVAGSAATSKATVAGFRRVISDSQADADDRLQDIVVEMTVSDSEILLKTDHPRGGPGLNYIVDYVIEVPQAIAITIINGNGAVALDDVTGGVAITAGNGDITAAHVIGDMRLTAGNGGIFGQVTLLSGTTVHADAGNGNIEIRVPKDTSALVDAMVGNGRISVSGLLLLDQDQNDSSLSGRLGAGDGSILLRTGNGNIALVGN